MSNITRKVIGMEKENDNVILVHKESDVEKYETEKIKKLIYTIRGKQVMLDSDVAMLYHSPTKRINEVVRRNIERFPEKFCFKLTEFEAENLRSQFATSKKLQLNPRLISLKPHVYLTKVCHKLWTGHKLAKPRSSKCFSICF